MEKTGIDAEKIQEALKKVEEIDAYKLFNTLVQMLRLYGEMGKRIGTLQRDNQDTFEAIGYLGSIAPQFMQALAKKSPPEELGVLVKTFLELFELSPKLENMMKLSAEEKIKIGERLIDIANTLEEMMEKVKGKLKE